MSAKKEHSGSDDGRIDENSYIEEAKKHGKDICRDYLNNICNRGSRYGHDKQVNLSVFQFSDANSIIHQSL